ncbi:MAG: pyridoxamine 5'-phosphate oxidase family protein [Nocardioidaceae bacterium]
MVYLDQSNRSPDRRQPVSRRRNARQEGATGAGRRGTFTELSTEECYRKPSQAVGIGRIGLCTSDGPLVLPVNYVVDGETLLVRTAPYTVIANTPVGRSRWRSTTSSRR